MKKSVKLYLFCYNSLNSDYIHSKFLLNYLNYILHHPPIFIEIGAGGGDQLVLQKRTGECLGDITYTLTKILCHCLVTCLFRMYIFVPNMHYWIIVRAFLKKRQWIVVKIKGETRDGYYLACQGSYCLKANCHFRIVTLLSHASAERFNKSAYQNKCNYGYFLSF
jgi:hypothetical protein